MISAGPADAAEYTPDVPDNHNHPRAQASLLGLPTELLQHILSYLPPTDLASTAQACRDLASSSTQDCIWQPIVQELSRSTITKPHSFQSFRDLYVSQHPRWFLTRSRLWLSDSSPHGKLVIARYDETTGSIVAYSVVARRSSHMLSFWEKDGEVVIHSFDPLISLDMNRPVLKIGVDSSFVQLRPNESPDEQGSSLETRYNKEILMDTCVESGLRSSFMLCRDLPPEAISESTRVWPPLRIPADGRARNSSQDNFHSSGHRPSTLREVSQNSFRVRKWVEYHGRHNPHVMTFDGNIFSAALGVPMPYFASSHRTRSGGGAMSIRVPEDVSTYGSLLENSYLPTPQKPYQGIWCGDYSGHGCEFLLVRQPDKDEASPLPEGMDWLQGWFAGRNRRRSSGGESFLSVQEEQQMDCDAPSVLQEASTASAASGRRATQSNAFPFETTPDYDEVPSGRLEAIKLTGDPNIP